MNADAESTATSKQLHRRIGVPVSTGIAGLAGGYLIGRLFAVPGSTQIWEVAAQPLATALAGAGAITAGYLAFHNGEKSRSQDAHHHKEKAERDREADLRERYTTAAQQLADSSPAIREAGVYAVAALADDWIRFGELTGRGSLAASGAQVCVNLLCSYLRASRRLVDRISDAPDPDEHAVRASIIEVLGKQSIDWRLEVGDWLKAGKVGVRSLIAVDLSRADLSGARLYEADLRGVRFLGADLSHAILLKARLDGAKLEDANLSDAKLNEARLDGASMMEVDLTGAHMRHVSLRGAELVRAKLVGAYMTGANLDGSNLHGAILQGARLGGATLTDANLRGANLVGANLMGVDLTGAALAGADVTGVLVDDDTTWPDGFTPRNLEARPAAAERAGLMEQNQPCLGDDGSEESD
ncbi:pentapeptide repeat-containing protein [Rhodococcus sp. JVH1]|uniref:pentapeptide repeat-containing protein n=1 Tax=Rhodococcus sp. JVH1 TaxID=745408 RepID=UPI000271E52D|nr:pentapeptide repeat-containing protein [Rhodococcus sp. JVH1]EJI98592.1 pentapeptide repeats family protein [Rhodococcus sp. JVH1]